jgi:hypothetical protein
MPTNGKPLNGQPGRGCSASSRYLYWNQRTTGCRRGRDHAHDLEREVHRNAVPLR